MDKRAAAQPGNDVERKVAIIEWRETFADEISSLYDAASSVLDFALYRLERGDFYVTEENDLPFDNEHVSEFLGDFKTWKEVANYSLAHLSGLRVPYFLLTGREKDKSLWQCPEVVTCARIYFETMLLDLERRYLEKSDRPDAYNAAEDWRNSGLTFSDLLA